MVARQEVMIEQGPDERGNHVGSAVVRTPNGRVWVSTVDLGRKPRAYETLVFPIPREVKLIVGPEGNPVFSKDFLLDEGGVGLSTANMRDKRVARRVHHETVQAVVCTLGGGGTR